MNPARVLRLAVGTIVTVGLLIGSGAFPRAGTATPAVQQVTLYVFRGEEGVKGPDGKGHDVFVPSSIVVKVGVPVRVTVINYDEGAHSITVPALKLNAMINPGHESGNTVEPVTTRFTFTPTKRGVYRWFCAVQCDMGGGYWAMTKGYDGPSQDGFMAGHIVVF